MIFTCRFERVLTVLLYISCITFLTSCNEGTRTETESSLPPPVINNSDTTVNVNDSVYIKLYNLEGQKKELKYLWQIGTKAKVDTLMDTTICVVFKDTGIVLVTVRALDVSGGGISTPDTVRIKVISKRNTCSIYSIGNSHTQDFEPFTGFINIAKTESTTIVNDWHINCGAPLYDSWRNPEKTCVEPNLFGKYSHALSTFSWDILTIQPFVGTEGFKEKYAVMRFIDYALKLQNKHTFSLFVYCTWPMNSANVLDSFDFSQAWLKEYHNENDSTVLVRAFFNYLIDSARTRLPEIKVISVGEVFYKFHEAAKSGFVPGFIGAGGLYRDKWHLNNVGRYIASLTVFSLLFNKNPLAIGDFEGFTKNPNSMYDKEMTIEQKKVFRTIISQAINSTQNGMQ